MSVQLFDFTRRALSKGLGKDEIRAALTQAGWAQEQITAALAVFSDVKFPVPVPTPNPYFSARESFLYLVMFSALYSCCYHVGSLLFDIINIQFPDAAMDRQFFWRSTQDSIRSAIATLIVSLPVFFYTFTLLNREIRREPMRRGSRVRKWLTYFTLLIATATLMIDGGNLIFNLLKGELTVRVILKALTVALIAGGNFWYFLRAMRTEENT